MFVLVFFSCEEPSKSPYEVCWLSEANSEFNTSLCDSEPALSDQMNSHLEDLVCEGEPVPKSPISSAVFERLNDSFTRFIIETGYKDPEVEVVIIETGYKEFEGYVVPLPFIVFKVDVSYFMIIETGYRNGKYIHKIKKLDPCDCKITCGIGVCEHTISSYANGEYQVCDPYEGVQSETCDNLDNNCDGTVDEELGETTCGLGVCEHTINNCIEGQEQICDPMEGASEEVCDGLDNDCDGTIGEDKEEQVIFSSELFVGSSDNIEDVAIIYDEERGIYKAWVTAVGEGADSPWAIYYTESESLFSWSQEPIEIISGRTQQNIGCGSAHFIDVVEYNEKYHMYYSKYLCGLGGLWQNWIYHRDSSDGISWSEEELVIRPNENNTTSDYVFPNIVETNEGLRLYYIYEYEDDPESHYWRYVNLESDGITISGSSDDLVHSRSLISGGLSIVGTEYHLWVTATETELELLVSEDGNTWTTSYTSTPEWLDMVRGTYVYEGMEYLIKASVEDSVNYLSVVPFCQSSFCEDICN